MASFEEILNKPASEIKSPPAYPVGSYHCVTVGPPAREESSQKKTPCFTFRFKIIRALEDVDQVAATEQQIVGKEIFGQGPGTAFYVTEEAAYRLKEFCTDVLGIEATNGSGQDRKLIEMVGDTPNKQLIVKLRHEISQDGKRFFHRVDSYSHV